MTREQASTEFGRRVRAAREKQNLSQEALADLAGVHRTYIGSVEQGHRNVSLTNILRISHALGVRPGELLDGLES